MQQEEVFEKIHSLHPPPTDQSTKKGNKDAN